MSTLDELINHRRDIALNIIKGFEQPVDETPVFSEKDFVKAQEDGLIEVFGVDAVSAFQRKIEKALLENPDANGLLEIEKAKRDLSKLVKVQKRDSKGRNMTYYVRATDKAKKDKEGGGKLAQTEEGKHYIVHSGKDQIVVKRKGTDAKGAPMFHPVDEHGKEQGDNAHTFHDKGVDKVEPYTEMDEKVGGDKKQELKKVKADKEDFNGNKYQVHSTSHVAKQAEAIKDAHKKIARYHEIDKKETTTHFDPREKKPYTTFHKPGGDIVGVLHHGDHIRIYETGHGKKHFDHSVRHKKVETE